MLTPNDDTVKNADVKSLKAAVAEDERHRFHAEAATSAASASPYYKRWVKNNVTPSIPSKSKRNQLLSQLAWPPVTVELVDEITDFAGAVHHAQDRYVHVDLADASLEADCYDFIERSSLRSFLTRNCHNQLFSGPNALVVVDLPAVQKTAFPEPYVYLIPSTSVRAAKPLTGPSDSGLFEFVWFDTDQKGVTALFDQYEVALFTQPNGSSEWQEVEGSRVPHNQPFCPAFKMWDDVEDSNPMVSNSMLRPVLGWLDRLIFWDGGGETNDLASAFMMLWHLETQRLDYQPVDGITLNAENQTDEIRPTAQFDDGTRYAPLHPTQAPNSDNSRSTYGPGTKIPIPAQRSKEDADFRVPAGWIAPPVENLKYIQEKGLSIRAKVLKTTTGYEATATKEAINEKQVLSINERSRLIYQYLASHYEVLERRILTAFCVARYGVNFLGCTVSYGRRVSMLTGEELSKLYKSAKDNGGAAWLLEELDSQQMEYYSRSDASRRLRFKMIRDLNKYPNRTASELRSLGVDQFDPEGYRIAVGLEGFIHRFERENDMSLEAFGSGPNYDDRINQILKRFSAYVSEQVPADPPGDPNGEQQPSTGDSKSKSASRRPKSKSAPATT